MKISKTIFLAFAFFVIYQINGVAQFHSPAINTKQQFEKQFPNHFFLWNKKTGMPHRAFGPSIPITNFSEINKENVEAASLAFLHTLPGWRDGLQLKMERAVYANDYWFVSFSQKMHGLKVWGSEVELRINKEAKVAAFGFDIFQEIPFAPELILPVETIKNSLQDFAADLGFKKIKINRSPEIFIVPSHSPTPTQVIYQIEWIAENAAHFESTWLDAISGTIIKRENRLCQANIEGEVNAEILPELATDIPAFKKLQHLSVQIGNEILTTNENGHFSTDITSPTTLTAQLKGPYHNVTRLAGQDAKIEMMVNPNDVIDLSWDNGNSLISERNVFYHTMNTYDFLKSFDPTLTTLNYPMKSIVEDTDDTCNAYWDGNDIHYNVGSGGCINAAHSAITIAHEYGHAINDRVYNAAGVLQGMSKLALHEAMADVTACLFFDEHQFALGFYTPGVPTRDLKNNRRYPEDVTGQQHNDGLMLAGSFWDLRELTSIETAYRLAHFAKYGAPDDPDLGIAFAEYFLEVLLADDDDGDLSNGTPHFAEINEAFCNHGIGMGLFFSGDASHEALENTTDKTNPYPVVFEYQQPVSAFGTEEIKLHYSTNYFQNENTVIMTPAGNGGFVGEIPAQPEGSVVKYYFTYGATGCLFQKFPSGEAKSEHFSFLVGDYTSKWKDDFQTDQGWTVGSLGDNATAGRWQWAIPQQTISDANTLVQPGSDYSENGTHCFVTGAAHGQFWYSHDVDGGSTTLISPAFSGIDGNETVVQYFKWYVDGAGTVAPTQDIWQTEISNNGGDSWSIVEQTTQVTNLKWTKVQFKISDFIEPTNNMRMRFVAADYDPGSIVEALIDDFEVLSIDGILPTEENIFENLVEIYPNPAGEYFYLKILDEELLLNYEVKIFDVLGKIMLQKNKLGKNNKINTSYFLSGVYFVEISNEDFYVVKKIIIEK